MIKQLLISELIIFSLIFLSTNSFGQEENLFFPDTVWMKHDSIGKIGYESKKFTEIRKFIIEKMYTTGLVVVVDGKILFEYGDIEELSYIASCRKSVLSLMYGKYIENGIIDLDKTLDELDIDDIQGLLPSERQATIKDIITTKSGVFHPPSNNPDWTKYAPQRGSIKPGEYCFYNNWDYNVAGAIFEQVTNKNIYEAFEQDIAIPIQMQDFKLESQEKSGDTTKSKYLAYHFWFSTRDMARLGLLLLNNGSWNKEQIISENWVKLTTSLLTPTEQMHPSGLRDEDFGYGYMWWIWSSSNEILEGSYWARGSFGNYLVIIPNLNMVISHKTKSDYERRTSFSKFKELVYLIIDSKNID